MHLVVFCDNLCDFDQPVLLFVQIYLACHTCTYHCNSFTPWLHVMQYSFYDTIDSSFSCTVACIMRTVHVLCLLL